MTTIHKIELESIFLISLVAAFSLFFVIQRNNQGVSVNVASPVTEEETKEAVYSQITPDGTKEVVMRITPNQDDTQTFSFYARDTGGDNERLILSKALDYTRKMEIPYNAWSSDNQYFFVKEDSEEGKKIFAFKANGEPFSSEEPYFDVTDLFKKQNTGYNFDEATGWASESLIIVNTTKDDGAKGSSYWFEVPSKAIIQLSTEF